MEKGNTTKTAGTIIAGVEYVKNNFYQMQSPAAKILMSILEKGLYDSAYGLTYGPQYRPESSIPSIPSPEIKKYLYHVPPLKFEDSDGTRAILRQMNIDEGHIKEIEPGYIIKERYADQLVALYKATHDGKRIGELIFRTKASDTGEYKKAETITLRREQHAPRGVILPSTSPNRGVFKRDSHFIGPGSANLPNDWRTRRLDQHS